MKVSCRLCQYDTQLLFEQRVLQKHLVGYYSCVECLSLQTETPYWIAESYENHLSQFDTGAVQRLLYNASLSTWICRILNVGKVIDFGGSDGMLTRLLRDHHISCYLDDKYAPNTYAQGFEATKLHEVDFVLAFEILEHFTHPREDLNSLFTKNPKYVLISTNTYNGQDSKWWYLAPDSGQHVFFYSSKALKMIGERYKYNVLTYQNYSLFYRDLDFFKKLLIKIVLKKQFAIFIKLFTLCKSVSGSDLDHEFLQKRSTDFIKGIPLQ